MNPEKWQELAGKIKEKYEVLKDIEAASHDGIGQVHTLIFNGPVGKIKLEFIVRPLKLGTKTHFSRRIGSDVSVEHEYSNTEQVHTLKAYSWNKEDETWKEINSADFNS